MILKRSIIIFLVMLSILCSAQSESKNIEEPIQPLNVQAKLLNGRSAPRKTASVEARFDFGDILQQTGRWSKNYRWVEVVGGETGTVWVYISYVSERQHYYMKNERHKSIKVRKWPVVGKVTGYIRKGQTVEIEQTIMGWGKTKHGWVDLSYLVEEG